MKTKTLTSGNFSANGNFSGYDAQGERWFVHGRAMEALGIKADSDLKDVFPLYAMVTEREIQSRDENGELSDTMVVRKQATTVFRTIDELVKAKNADIALEIAIKADLEATVSKSGLTEASVKALLEASI